MLAAAVMAVSAAAPAAGCTGSAAERSEETQAALERADAISAELADERASHGRTREDVAEAQDWAGAAEVRADALRGELAAETARRCAEHLAHAEAALQHYFTLSRHGEARAEPILAQARSAERAAYGLAPTEEMEAERAEEALQDLAASELQTSCRDADVRESTLWRSLRNFHDRQVAWGVQNGYLPG